MPAGEPVMPPPPPDEAVPEHNATNADGAAAPAEGAAAAAEAEAAAADAHGADADGADADGADDEVEVAMEIEPPAFTANTGGWPARALTSYAAAMAAAGAAAAGEAGPSGAEAGTEAGAAAGTEAGAEVGGAVTSSAEGEGEGEEPPPPRAPWAYRGALEGHTDHVVCLATHPNIDRLAASGGKDAAIVLWDHHAGEALRTLRPGCEALDLAHGTGASDGALFAAIDAPTHANGCVPRSRTPDLWLRMLLSCLRSAATDREVRRSLDSSPQPRGARTAHPMGYGDGAMRLLAAAAAWPCLVCALLGGRRERPDGRRRRLCEDAPQVTSHDLRLSPTISHDLP